MSIAFTSNKSALAWSQVETLTAAYAARVAADGGTIADLKLVASMYADLLSAGLYGDSLLIAMVAADAGIKVSAGAVVKAYSLAGVGGDMAPASGSANVTIASQGTPTARNCFFFNGSAMLITSTGVAAGETTMVLEAKAGNASLRPLARLDATTGIGTATGQVGAVQVGSTVGWSQTGYTTAGGTEQTYATYADFQRMGFIARTVNSGEIFVDGASVASKNAQKVGLPARDALYFKLGGAATTVSVNRALAYGGVLRAAQMAKL